MTNIQDGNYHRKLQYLAGRKQIFMQLFSRLAILFGGSEDDPPILRELLD
jgi:hypothetical protein